MYKCCLCCRKSRANGEQKNKDSNINLKNYIKNKIFFLKIACFFQNDLSFLLVLLLMEFQCINKFHILLTFRAIEPRLFFLNLNYKHLDLNLFCII